MNAETIHRPPAARAARDVPATSAKPKRMIALRAATPRDITALYDCLIEYFAECALYYPGAVEKDAMAWGMGIIMDGGCIVAECDGKIIGSVGVAMAVYPWNKSVRYLDSVWLFVIPAFRKGGTGIKLIEAAKQIAVANKMALRLDEVMGFEVDLLGKLKQRMGFHRVGGNWAFIPGDPNPPVET